jgi:REP element-mobilizing transposase RayT
MLDRIEIDRLFALRLDHRLDASHGRCELRRADLAEIVAGALKYFDRDRYELTAWCVMPNHVHVIVAPALHWRLETILQSWKSYTAKRVNAALGRQGQFWQREYFDRLIRDRDDYLQAARYVLENPEKAGMKGWPFAWCDPDLRA